VLTIRADGNATLVDPWEGRPAMNYKLTQAEIQDLMKSIVLDEDFFKIRRAEISKAMDEEDRKTGISMTIFDASTTVLHVTTADQDLELRFNALGTQSKRYPTIQPLQRLSNVTKRLDRLIAEFTPGARERIASALEAANNALRQEQPGLPMMVLNDFNETVSEADGTSITKFFRVHADHSTLVATVTVSPGMPPNVTIKKEERPRICFEDSKVCFDTF